MKQVFKKLFVTLLGLSIIVAPLVCCCMAKNAAAPQVMASHKSCHQTDSASQQSPSQGKQDNCCPQIASSDVDKVTTALYRAGSAFLFSTAKAVSFLVFNFSDVDPSPNAFPNLVKLKSYSLPICLQFSILRL
ncbi:MAG: hypothetical protein A2Z88_09575 [Omnitrophica WOR_2 bacterium GWA2_47_8]|nr:MAG: hypothetical protein A2Z88_09575 [Omnitrophica WOR_2 bacterium GWA2_47_8]